jgi:hypothetical protein
MLYGMSTKKKYRIQENYKLHFTHSNCVLFSTAECLTCVFSFYMHATEALLLARLQKLMPTETSVTCHMLQSVQQKKQWNLVPSTFFYFYSPSQFLTGYHFSIKESHFPEVCHGVIWQSTHATSHFMLQNATAIYSFYMHLVYFM